MKRLTTIYIAIILVVGLGTILMPAYASAATGSQVLTGDLCEGYNGLGGAVSDEEKPAVCTAKEVKPTSLIKQITVIVTIVLGVAAVIALIYGGLLFVMAHGDSAKITKARSVILYAVVGVALSAIAGTLAAFVVDRL